MPVKHFDMQTAINTHLSQSAAAGNGQHGISLAISLAIVASVMVDGNISSATACVEALGNSAAITGWESGAQTSPAIITTASSRRMAI